MTDDRLLLDGIRLTDTERLKLLREEYAALGIDDIYEARNGIVSTRLSMVATAPRATPSQAFAAALHGDEGRSVDSLAEPLLALTLWQERMGEV